MLTLYQKPQFVERVVTDRNGRCFRLVFLVASINGELKARLVSAIPLGGSFKCASEVPCLPVAASEPANDTPYLPASTPVVSPYLELLFFVSQPTRAPSFAF